MQPELIGARYRVLAPIGQGGMGTVWRCRDEKLARDVAVKQVGLLPGQSVTDSARAFREARSSAALSHRNVVTVFDVVEEADHIWLVMEYVPSRSLSEIIREDGPLPPDEVAHVGAQVADGLAAAHAAGITHRDVKPGNVLVTDEEVAKISDFGIARTMGDPALTQSGLFMGTPLYFSPELARGDEAGSASDVWALGATLYAAVEGRPPYEPGANPVALLRVIATQNPPAPRRADFLEPALARMLDRDPASRWSMADAAHALHRLAAEHAEHAEDTRETTPAAFPRPSPEPDPEPDPEATRGTVALPAVAAADDDGDHGEAGRRRGWVYAALIVVALLVVGGLVMAAIQGGGDETPSAAGGSTTPTPSPTPSSKPSATSAGPRSEASTPSPSRTRTTPRNAASVGSKAAFVKRYYATVPDDLDAGWAMLSPRFQSQVGRSSYDGFWSTVQDVQATDVSVSGSTADVTLHYVMDDGRASNERSRLDLVSSGSGYLIDDQDSVG